MKCIEFIDPKLFAWFKRKTSEADMCFHHLCFFIEFGTYKFDINDLVTYNKFEKYKTHSVNNLHR